MTKPTSIDAVVEEFRKNAGTHIPQAFTDYMETTEKWLCERLTTLVEQARGEQKIDENTSDGYHTFKELYEFRKLYNAVLFNEWYAQGKYQVHKSTKHADGEDCFGGGWFIVMATLPTGQISNHYEMKDWNTFACETRDKADVWDGHTAQDVAQRLADLAARTISSDKK